MPGDDLLGFLLGCGCEARCCCGQSAPAPAARPSGLFQQSGRGQDVPRLPEDTPFIPSVPSFDSPQRPVPGHSPSVDAAGAFVRAGELYPLSMFNVDTGALTTISECVIDHQARTVRYLSGAPAITDTPPDVRAYGVPSFYASSDLNGDPRVEPADRSEITVLNGRAAQWTVRTLPMTGDPPADEVITTTAPARVLTGRVLYYGYPVVDYRRQQRWSLMTGEPDSPSSIWRRTLRVIAVHPGGVSVLPDPPYETYDVLHARSDDRTRAAWEALGTPPGEDSPVDNDSGFPIFETLDQGDRLADLAPQVTPPEPDLGPDRWISAGVRVTGPRTLDHALLAAGEALATAGGHVISGPGSWAGLCGPVQADSTPEVWVLVETGGAVTRIRPDGSTEAIDRTTFEVEVLRAPPGSFRRFASEGTLTHTWPPQWAVADCGAAGGARAVTLHDPWRDSVPGRPPERSTDPAWWWWPTRPRRRPAALPLGAPVAPLRLALADAWESTDPGDGGDGGSS